MIFIGEDANPAAARYLFDLRDNLSTRLSELFPSMCVRMHVNFEGRHTVTFFVSKSLLKGKHDELVGEVVVYGQSKIVETRWTKTGESHRDAYEDEGQLFQLLCELAIRRLDESLTSAPQSGPPS